MQVPAAIAGAAAALGRRRRRRIASIGIAVTAAVLMAAGWHSLTGSAKPDAPVQATVPASAVAVLDPAPAAASNQIYPTPSADERSGNLQAAFAALWQSERRVDKARALSIWNACVPVFLGAGTQAPSLQRAIAGLPSDPRYDTQRSAYADLFGRCKQFYGDSNADLSARTSQLHRSGLNGDAVTSARLAAEAAARGGLVRARSLAAQSLASGEPYELFELAGTASRLLAADATPQQRTTAMLQDLALPLAACELGLDCQLNSLLAVRLCAFEALCEGTVQDRLRGKYAPDIAPANLAPEVARLVAIVGGAGRAERGSAQRASQAYFSP